MKENIGLAHYSLVPESHLRGNMTGYGRVVAQQVNNIRLIRIDLCKEAADSIPHRNAVVYYSRVVHPVIALRPNLGYVCNTFASILWSRAAPGQETCVNSSTAGETSSIRGLYNPFHSYSSLKQERIFDSSLYIVLYNGIALLSTGRPIEESPVRTARSCRWSPHRRRNFDVPETCT
jgi:hypothetical protein